MLYRKGFDGFQTELIDHPIFASSSHACYEVLMNTAPHELLAQIKQFWGSVSEDLVLPEFGKAILVQCQQYKAGIDSAIQQYKVSPIMARRFSISHSFS
ncbi:hypothetical protein NEF87_004893 [Candidatus Lokiarchaeum ossiferum]|uniref:Uncharacterized protein n=1 Tax=Candidatus Lokiarchaeum ossiferum TaxID=2951803 RepID=A0ABY6HYJ7_9ARCH|nr:hypothetical protein NEF87_004893 [Candidatus Lokiarchaeum sp. B-35]